jgi:DNA-binding response OmpR family regulator
MLLYFMKNPNRILSKDMILNTVWGHDYEPEARVVDTLIARLRKKIDQGFEPKFISTERGVGYSFRTSDWRKGREVAHD